MQNPTVPSRQKARNKFAFQSEIVTRYLTPGPKEDVYAWCPGYVLELFVELREQARGMDFYPPQEDAEDIHISMFDRPTIEICELVDWTVGIFNRTVAKELRNRALSVQEILRGEPMREGWSSRDSLRVMFEGWGEDGDEWGTDYVSTEIFPFTGGEDPLATPGNLCAAFGLAILDHALLLRSAPEGDNVIETYGAAWHFALTARSLNRQHMGYQFDLKAHSARMSKAAAKRYSKDPKQVIKAQVKEHWQRWKEQPNSYVHTTTFARAMQDKWPDELTSEPVICKWVREWNSAVK